MTASPAEPHSIQQHTATLIAMLRAGEQSAFAAFGGILLRLSPGEHGLAAPHLAQLIADEERHERALAVHADRLPGVAANDAMTRRFFRSLESREPRIHLARIAALDGCVCQVLASVLAQNSQRPAANSLFDLLSTIRTDEAHHVRVTRNLCCALGSDAESTKAIVFEVRHGFAGLLASRADSFAALGVDAGALILRIRRESGDILGPSGC